MDMNDYQDQAARTAVYPSEHALAYLALGLVGEAGEVANKIKKILRGDYDDDPVMAELVLAGVTKELGDVLWYTAMLATELDTDLRGIALGNLSKLYGREIDGTLKGSGDDR